MACAGGARPRRCNWRWPRPDWRPTALLVAGSPFALGIGVAPTGLTIPLILVLCTLLSGSAVHQAVLTQAFVWLNSASAAGSASAEVSTGWAVTTFGAHGGFAVAAMATRVAAMLAVAGLQAPRVPLQPKSARQVCRTADPS
jgi:hypothetical protein